MHQNNTNDSLLKQCVIYNCPAEPQGKYGGWYLSAKPGDTFGFSLEVGTGDDGPNWYEIYLGDELLTKQSNWSSSYEVDFNYTFKEQFSGWLYIDVGWGFYVKNINTTATVKGRGNYWGNDSDCRMYDEWATGTPSYRFQYDNSVLSME